MSSKAFIAIFIPIITGFAAPAIVQAAKRKAVLNNAVPKPTRNGHVAVNGVNYYYAVYGTGEPLLLLHGGLGQIEMFGRTLTTLAEHAGKDGNDSRAVTWWRRAAELDPLDSNIALALVRALTQAGDRSGALRHARQHAEALDQQLGVPPDPRLTDLMRQLSG